MGRAEKYADVVQKYEEEQEAIKKDKEKEIETEEKLSMTRELKFQTIQKKLDDTTTVGDAEEIVKLEEPEVYDKDITSEIEVEENALNNTDTLEVETLDEEILEEPKEEKKVEEKSVELISSKEIKKAKNEIEDDLYLTSSLKPLRKRFKLRKVFKVLFSFILFVLVLVGLYFFGFKPLYNFLVNSKPRKVFENSIDYVVSATKKNIEGISYENDILYTDFSFKINSNMEDYGDFGSYYFGYGFGSDPVNKKFQESTYIKINGQVYSIDYIESGGKAYAHFSSSDNYISLGDIEDLDEDTEYYNQVSESLKYLSSTFNQDNIYYILDKEAEIIKGLFEDEMFSKASDELDINGTSVKVTRNTLKLNAQTYKRVVKKYAEDCLKDDELIKKLASIYDQDEKELRKEYENLMTEEVEDNYELIINIYTNVTNKFMGFDITENGFRLVYLYTKDNNYTAHFNFTEDEDCLEGKDCVVTNQEIFDIEGINKDSYTELNIKYNGNNVAKINLRSFNEKIDFDYEIYVEDETYKGDVMAITDKEQMVSTIDVTVIFKDNEYINVKGDVKLKAPDKFGYVNLDNVVPESRIEKEADEFSEYIGNDEIVEVLFSWYDLSSDPGQIFEEETSEA